MLYFNNMKSVFDRIMESRPGTFTTFSPTGPVESGVSPVPVTSIASGVSYLQNQHFVPGSLSNVAAGTASSITYRTSMFRPPLEGGSWSFEMIRMSPKANETSTSTIISVPGMVSVSYGVAAGGASYSIVIGSKTIEVTTVPGRIDHIAVSFNSEEVTFILNGVRHVDEMEIPPATTGNLSITLDSTSNRVWGIAVRSTPATLEYCQEVTELLNDFPTVADADESFRGLSFTFTPDALEEMYDLELGDLEYDGDSISANLYNGADVSPLYEDFPIIAGLGIAVAENVGAVLSISDKLNTTIEGDLSLTTAPVDRKLTSYSSSTLGEPEVITLDLRPQLPALNDGSGMSLSLKLLASPVVSLSQTSPERTVTLSPDNVSYRGSEDYGLFSGMIVPATTSSLVVDPIPYSPTSADMPEAYGMWVFVDSASSGAARPLITATGMTLSLSSTLTITKTGIGNVYVDGTLYSSGAVASGWRHISFIPTTKTGGQIALGGSIYLGIHSFSEYYDPSPATYLPDVYRMYVNPKSATPTTPDPVLSITDGGCSVYAHDWSISSAD